MTMNFALLLHKLLNSLIQSSHAKRPFPQGGEGRDDVLGGRLWRVPVNPC